MIGERKDGESLMVSRMPQSKKYNRDLVAGFEPVRETITALRAIKLEKQIPARDPVELIVRAEKNSFDQEFLPVIVKMANLSGIRFVSEKPSGSASFMVRTTEYFVPLGNNANTENERARVIADLEYFRGFLASVMKKLDNERFVQNAPASVLELERKKKADTELKIKSLEESLEDLGE
jgi:valyl-tRNA synthetase